MLLVLFVFICCTLSPKHYALTLIHHFLSSKHRQLPHLLTLIMLLTRLLLSICSSSSYSILLDLLCFLSSGYHQFSYPCRRSLQAERLLRFRCVSRLGLNLLIGWGAGGSLVIYWLLIHYCVTWGLVNAEPARYLVVCLIQSSNPIFIVSWASPIIVLLGSS
jgi:hypothetical protein